MRPEFFGPKFFGVDSGGCQGASLPSLMVQPKRLSKPIHIFFPGGGTKKKVWPQGEVSSLGRPLNFTIESVYHADCVRYKVLGCRGRSLLLHCVGRTARLQAADVQHRGLQH